MLKSKIKKILIDNLILDFQSYNRGWMFPEINELLEKNNINYKGDSCIFYNDDFNILAWCGISKDYMNAILELEKELDLIEPVSFITHLTSGGSLGLPIAKKNYKYKKPHWQPCILGLSKKNIEKCKNMQMEDLQNVKRI